MIDHDQMQAFRKPTLLVCGGRKFADVRMMRALVFEACEHLHEIANELGLCGQTLEHFQWVRLVHGAARGADTIAGLIGQECGMEVCAVPAEWDRHGKAAGSLRNTEMLIRYKPDLVLAVPGGTGTNDMVTKALRFGVKVIDRRTQ